MAVEAGPLPDDEITYRVIGAAMEVHSVLGPGFLESIYAAALCHELQMRAVRFEAQKEILVPYKGLLIPGQRLDLLVEDRIVVELKTVDRFAEIHVAQVMSYLKATKLRLGLLLNFKTGALKDGIKRIIF
jgi:GxxExxY protein